MASRVFISSTRVDLADYREAVRGTVRQLGAVDISMEHFGARDELPKDECLRLVRSESDLFVGIYAHRYGYIPAGDTLSITESEYHAAGEAHLPRFIYLVDDDHPWRPGHIDAGAVRERLLAFKAALMQTHICQRFTGPDHLAAKVAADLGRHLARQNAPRVGPNAEFFEDIELVSLRQPAKGGPTAWLSARKANYENSRRVFLAHVLEPSAKPGQEFDVYIYAVRHKSEDLSDISYAEFFLGPYWNNKVFAVRQQNGFVGITTSAYGPFLCLCKLVFKDGHEVLINRYIDFEAKRGG